MKIPNFKGIPTREELQDAIKNKYPLFLGIPLGYNQDETKKCNLKCIYCFIKKREKKENKTLLLEDNLNIINQFAELGGKYIKTATIGEPFLDQNFFNPKNNKINFPLIDYAKNLGIYWTSFSNLLLVTKEIADELYKKDVSLIGKLNSLNPEIQEELTGNTGQYKKENWIDHEGISIPKNLKYLIDAGFNNLINEDGEEHTRLGVDIIITKLNYKDIPNVVKFCLENNIYPDMETLEISGDAINNLTKLNLELKDKKWLYKELIKITGKEFLGQERISTSDCCPIFTAGIVYNPDGSLRFCYNKNANLGFNLKNDNLAEVYFQMLEIKQEIIPRVLKNYQRQKGIINPCPMGEYRDEL